MDDVETPAERKIRQFDWLRRTGNFSMRLAEAYGAAALAEIERPPAPEAPPTPATRRPDHGKAFMAASASVRQIIALELRLEAGPVGARQPAAFKPPPPPDPRRPLLQRVLHDAVRNEPDRARRRRAIDHCIEEELRADPDGEQPIAETLSVICNKLEVDVELARLPDAFLDFDEPVKTLSRTKIRQPTSG